MSTFLCCYTSIMKKEGYVSSHVLLWVQEVIWVDVKDWLSGDTYTQVGKIKLMWQTLITLKW